MTRLNGRKLHRLLSAIAGFPLLIMILTGVLIQLKPWLPHLQPETEQSGNPAVARSRSWSIAELYALASPHAGEHLQSIEDIRAIDIRPSLGVARIRTQDHHEIQIDLASAQVLRVEPRYVGWMIALHEGALFGKEIRYGLWVPSSILGLLLSASGFWILLRRRKLNCSVRKEALHVQRVQVRS